MCNANHKLSQDMATLRRARGFVLIEVLTALLILSFIFMGLVAGYGYCSRVHTSVNERLHALAYASYVAGKIQTAPHRFSKSGQWVEDNYVIRIVRMRDAQYSSFYWYLLRVSRVHDATLEARLIVGVLI